MTKDQDEKYGGPNWLQDDVDSAGGFTTGAIADALKQPGLGIPKLTAQIRGFAKKGYIHPYGRSRKDRRQAYFYRTDQVLISAVLSLMAEAGISDAASFRAASNALYSWNEDDIPESGKPARSPAMHVIKAALLQRNGWSFELVNFRHKDHGLREVRARIRNINGDIGTNFHLPDGFERRSAFVVDLDEVMRRLFSQKGK